MTISIPQYEMVIGRNRLPRLSVMSRQTLKAERLQEPAEYADMFRRRCGLGSFAEEHFFIAALNACGRLKGVFEISHGTYGMCHVSPGPLFARLLLAGASGFIAAHNHPSGFTEPSAADRRICVKLSEAGFLLDLRLLDFLIVTDKDHFSFYEKGMLRRNPGD